MKIIIFLLIIALPISRSFNHPPQDYFNYVLVLIKTHSYYRESLNLAEIESQYHNQVTQAKTIEEIHPIVNQIFRAQGDLHSHLINPSPHSVIKKKNLLFPKGCIIQEKVGYLYLPTFNYQNQQAKAYALQAQRIICRLGKKNLKGWIIDLRDNEGGNMWPMLAAMGPLLGNGIIGAFIYLDHLEYWDYHDGIITVGHHQEISLNERGCDTTFPEIPTAILVNSHTASAAEAVVIAFQGRSRTYLFGQPTAGLTTANERYILPDGAELYLATAVFANRSGQVATGSINPHEITRPDETLKKAIKWLYQQDDFKK